MSAALAVPDEGLGLMVVLVDVVADSHDQFIDVAEDASAQAILGKIPEEAFNHVQP